MACGERGCSAPPWSHLCTTGKYRPKFKIKGSGLSHEQGRASRAGLSVARVEGGRSGHPSTRSRVSHSNPSWPLHTLERWRQPRGRKWPAAGPGPAVPKQGSPGHTRPPAQIAHPSPAGARCAPWQSPPYAVAALGSPHTRTSMESSIPPSHSPGGTPGAQPPAQSLGQPATGGGDSGVPRTAAAWGRAVRQRTSCSAALLLLLWRRLRHVTPWGPPPSTRRPVPRRVPTRQSITRAQGPPESCLATRGKLRQPQYYLPGRDRLAR